MKAQDDGIKARPRLNLTRRRLLTQGAVAAGGLALQGASLLLPSSASASSLTSPEMISKVGPSFTTSALRREDMLALRFDFYNLVLAGTNLARQTIGTPAYIVVSLSHGTDSLPQNIAERAYLEADPTYSKDNDIPNPPGYVDVLLAGPTRLAFKVPDTVNTIPFSLHELLAWVKYEQNVVPVALPAGTPRGLILPAIRAPGPTETNIEAPWNLILSPSRLAGWAHARGSVTHAGRTELWHTRLGVRTGDPATRSGYLVDEQSATNRTLRAVWTPGFSFANQPPVSDLGPFRMSLIPNDRWQLVRLTSDFGIQGYTPQPVDAERFMLSSLGAWMNTRGFWSPPLSVGLNIEEWRHLATMGRDQYVKVVKKGYLYPTGHAAVLFRVTERKFQATQSGQPAAYLRQRFFIVVRQPVKTYPAAGQPDAGRKWPFKQVAITTLITPNLDDPDDPDWDIQDKAQDAFWPHILVNGAKQGFEFHLVAEDSDGQKTEFAAPLAFMEQNSANDVTFLDQANGDYADLSENADRRARSLDGQKVAFAPSTKPGDTSVAVKSLTLGAVLPDPAGGTLPIDQPHFYPTWTEAEVRLTGVEQVAGGALPAPTVVEPHPDYLTTGFDSNTPSPTNPADVFLKMKNAVPLSFTDAKAGDKSGGLITPNMAIAGFSRLLGPMGGNMASVPKDFDPTDFLSDAKILGGLLLKEIISTVVGFADLGKVPKTVTRTVYPDDNSFKPPEAIETEMSFKPDLQADPANVFDPKTDKATMSIKAKFRVPLYPSGDPTYDILGDLRSFRINMLGDGSSKFLVLRFNQLTFTAKSGKKPHVDVDINKVEFAGVLSFVNTLKDYLKSGKSGPSLDVTPTGVTAGYTLAIPTIGMGLLTIQNISFSSQLTVPFTGKPARVRFAFCERESPFVLTVMGLGGGGFFGIAIGLDGVEMLEASLEATASLALDVGIASGEIHATVGIYFKMEKTDTGEQAELKGYIRMGGSLDVMGLISISIELYLELRYEFPPVDELWGQATLTINIHVIFFSINVDVSVERKLAGSGGSHELSSPTKLGLARPAAATAVVGNFANLVSEHDWADYSAAFAPVFGVS